MEIVLWILAGLAAVGLGFWLGLPGKYEQTPEDIEKAMERGGARRNQVKKVFTPLDWFRKEKRGSQRRIDAGRRRFRTAAPETSDGGDGNGNHKPATGPRRPERDDPGDEPGDRARRTAADEFADRHRSDA